MITKERRDKTCYTINRDGTLEKWHLRFIKNGIAYLRKTPKEKWISYCKDFDIKDVYPFAKDAKQALKANK